MNLHTIILSIVPLSAALLLSGCGGSDETTAQAGNPGGGDGEIRITGNDQMQFSPTEFTVAAGEEVTVVFENIGRMPKESMGHNLAVLEMGVNVNAFADAARRHADNEYIAPEYEDQVIAATAILGPREDETITFTAPDETGDYPFVCSFPGHTQAGMTGVMIVE